MNGMFRMTALSHIATVRSAVLVASLLFGGAQAPAFGALFDDNEARRQIAVERKRVDDAAAQIGANKQQLDTIAARLGKLEESVSKNQAVLDLFREIENLKTEIAKMRGQMEVLANGIETSQKRSQDFYVDLDTRLRRIESANTPPAGAASTPDIPPSSAPASPAAAATSTSPTGAKPGASPVNTASTAGPTSNTETRAYEAAQNHRRIGNYQAAIVAFQSFVKQYPKSTLAPSAQYWIGDSYFNLRDFRMAINSQRLLLASYPDSPKVPDALLNIASSQLEMGESAAARKTMDEIVAKHPTSDAADKAKRRIANLR